MEKEQFLKTSQTYLEKLFPICRSLTGLGNRQSLKILQELVDLKIHEVSSGTTIYDWTVPSEWTIRDAWIKDSRGQKVIDFQKNNLHLVSYSQPIHQTFSFEELKSYLHTLPQHPDLIPYRTSYYKEAWGFCLSQKQWDSLDPRGTYEVFIDSELNPNGSLTYAETYKKGEVDEEIILSAYFCHPSMANDSLSGVINAVLLFQTLLNQKTYYSYRLVLVPETLGALTYLHQNEKHVKENVTAAAVITTCGGPGPLGLKPSFLGNHEIDLLARKALDETKTQWVEYPFVPDGSDERQYSSPGFRIPSVSITKDKYYEYRQYHTSGDNLDFVKPQQLWESFQVYNRWVELLESNRQYTRAEPHGEFQLGKRGLYPNLGGALQQGAAQADAVTEADVTALSWLMWGCDGSKSLLEIAALSKVDFDLLHKNARRLLDHRLIHHRPQ